MENTLTQHQKIIAIMIRQKKAWHLPQDFMRPELGELFVGYEAGARIAELGKLYPEMIESVREGKYMKRRFRFDNVLSFYHALPQELKYIIKRELGAPGDQGALFSLPPHTHG